MPLTMIPHDVPMTEAIMVPADRLIAGDPRQGVANLYSDAGGEFHCGLWSGAPATWRVRYSEHEFCHILAGRIRIREQDGGEWLVGAGDSFVVPAGFVGTWEILEPARKIYVIFEPRRENSADA